MTSKLEFHVVYVCTQCLEECHLAELEDGHTPCCGSKYTKWGLNLRVEFLELLEDFHRRLETSFEDLQSLRQHVRTMYPDAKKRRKTYDKPDDVWPGRLSQATTKRGMKAELEGKPQKKSPPVKRSHRKVDIISSPENNSWVVDIIVGTKAEHQISGKDRNDARRKARQWLRGKNMSITNANQILEEEGKTQIIFT